MIRRQRDVGGPLGWTALQVLRLGIRRGSLTLRWPNGGFEVIEGSRVGPHVEVQVHRVEGLKRLAINGGNGLAEGYIEGDFDTEDLAGLVEFAALHMDAHHGLRLPRPVVDAMRALWRDRGVREDGRGPVKDIVHHYDLGNDFYSLWLDPTMTYSSGVFTDDAADLQDAQREKYGRLASELDIREGHRVLEIGSGWGGFARYAAAELGADVTTVTISREQAGYVEKLVAKEGLSDRVDVRLEDFLWTSGTFDRIVSIEMIESIPARRWPEFFRTLRNRLAPGGLIGLQAITIADPWWSRYDANPDFIRRYVFPGGQLPSLATMRGLARDSGLAWRSAAHFGPSYARTLAAWRERFEAALPRIEELGFDERFRRLWRYYLSYCEGGFRSGRIDVGQIILEASP